MEINISQLNKAEVLAALYNNANPQGIGFWQFTPEKMSTEQAADLLKGGHSYFDYLKGRVMKVDLSADILCTRLYDRDNGEGAAQRALQNLIDAVSEDK